MEVYPLAPLLNQVVVLSVGSGWYTMTVPDCELLAEAAVTVDELGPYVDVIVVVEALGLMITTVPAVPWYPVA